MANLSDSDDSLEFPAEMRTPLTRRKTSFVHHITFSNFNGFIRACVAGEARLQHMTPMNIMFSAKICYDRFLYCSGESELLESTYSNSTSSSQPALWKKLLSSFHHFIVCILLIQIGLCFTFAGPAYVVKQIIMSAVAPGVLSYFWCFVLSVLMTGYSLFTNHNFYRMYYGALQQRAALLTALYDKCLHVHPDARSRYGAGDILNLASVDVAQVFLFTQYCGMLIGIPARTVLSCLMVSYLLGPGALGMTLAVGIMMPLSIYVAYRLYKINRECMVIKDKRIDLTSEVLSGMKIIKLFGWEEAFINRILKIREVECEKLKSFLYGESIAVVIWNSSPFIVAAATYGTFIFWDRKDFLRADAAFTSLMIFGILRFYFIFLPMVLSKLVQARVALKRIENFLNCEEIEDPIERFVEGDDIMIDIRRASFAWGEEVALRDIDLKVKRGELVAVLGHTGSGKTSLLSAMLGEMNRVSGSIAIRDVKIAYVPQQAWIQSGTIRQNILFKHHLDKQHYSKVIKNCCLRSDIRLFSEGDQTEVGDRGMHLSGGQKQRVSIARAVYHQAEMYLFDDPLSALDAHVADEIFRQVFSNRGMLRHTTRVIATHNQSILPLCDRILVLENGSITASGTYDEIAGILNFRRRTSITPRESEDRTVSGLMLTFLKTPATATPSEEELDAKFNIEDEVKQGGGISWKVYATILNHFGTRALCFTAVAYIAFRTLDIGSIFWVKSWTDEIEELIKTNQSAPSEAPFLVENYSNHTVESFTAANPQEGFDFYKVYQEKAISGLFVFVLIGLAAATSTLIGFITLAMACHRVSIKLHESMLFSILKAPLSFFDITPVGRIINRFSKDVSVMDVEVYQIFDDYTGFLLAIFGCIILVYVELPIMTIVLIPVGILFMYIRHIYLEAARQSKRLMLMCRSPVLNDFAEVLNGAPVIRAFKAEAMLLARNHLRVDVSQNTVLHNLATIRWAAVRADALNAVMTFVMVSIILFNGHRLGVGTAGLLISYTITVTRFMARFIESSTLLESAVVSAERLFEYGNVAPEAPWKLEPPPDAWPSQGVVELQNYSCRYREGTPLVLNNVSLKILAGHKVGIVGRTGAGKSSLTLALFRVIEPAAGRILIDGIDTSTLGLHDLRKRLTMIPQDPILFRGTLRNNLDPGEEFPEEAVEAAARTANLRAELKLTTQIHEEGSNISLGERQLICLARALLRKSKILVLDEATAAVDLVTDAVIQKTIREVFATSTVITIAHRLQTVMDYDMVVVMSAGEIIEKGNPRQLIAKRDSQFHAMAKDAGLVAKMSSASS